MSMFFLAVEAFMYLFAGYLFLYKRELSIIYIPVLLFIRSFIDPVMPASLYVSIVSMFFMVFFYKNPYFFYKNIWSFLLFFWYIFLLHKAVDLELIRTVFIAMLWLIVSIPMIMSIYQKYTKSEILDELANASFIILVLFCLNTVFSTVFKYAPEAMYGITTGVLYGHLYATDFNILSTAVFILLLSILKKKNILYLIVLVASFAFIMLTLRRSVMLLSMLGLMLTVLINLDAKNIKTFFMIGVVSAFFGFVIIMNTPFMDILIERYETRNLEERELQGEHRFFEYELIYKDMFLFHDYSPWTGYGLFDSAGNYGKGVLGMRSLHSDVTNITHSTGLIGLVLYFFMIILAFVKAIGARRTKLDLYLLGFCLASFIFYTVTGRYSNIQSHFLIFLLLFFTTVRDDEVEEPDIKSASVEIDEKNHEEVQVL